MKITELLKKLNKAKEMYGDLPVLMECDSDVAVNYVCYVHGYVEDDFVEHIRLTDDIDAIYALYEEADIEIMEI